MAPEALREIDPSENSHGLEAQPRPPFTHSPDSVPAADPGPAIENTPDSILRAAPSNVTCNPTPPESRVHRSSHGPLSSTSRLFGRYLSAITGGLRQRWEERKLKNYKEAIAFTALLMAGLALWPALTAASDGHKSEVLAEWAARKDILSDCAGVHIQPTGHHVYLTDGINV